MSGVEPQALPASVAPPRGRGRRSSVRGWRRGDQLIFVLAWTAGLGLCLVAGAIVIFLGVEGLRYLDPKLLVTSPSAAVDQAHSGGFLDPLIGTLTMAVLGTLIATPLAVLTAVWVVEYGRPRWLAAVVETSIEMIAGTPDIVIAIFGLAFFQLGILAPVHATAAGGRDHDVAARAAADLHRDPQRPARDPAPAARGLVRARQDPRRDDP